MFKYLELFINNNRDVAELSAWIDKNITQDREELEHICDYFMGIEKPNYKLSYKNAMAKAKRWVESMRKDTTNEIEGVDYEIVYKTKDGLMKFVKLLTKEAYENESSNMRHCIRTYWGNDREVFSLRDDVNMPHATMDIVKNGDTIMQIQGKGDNTVDGKYQQYNMEFLEYMGFTINSDFLKKIGYYKIDDIDKGLTSQKSYNGYIHESHIDTLQDSEGRKYRGMGLWDVHPLVDIDDEGNCRLFDDINSVFEYTKLVNKGDIDKIYAQNSSSGYFAQNSSSGDFAKNASSGFSAQNASSGDFAQNASSGYFAKNASSGDFAQNSSSGDFAQNSSSGKSAKNASSGKSAKNASSGDYAKNASSGKFAQNSSSGKSAQNSSSGDYAQNSSSGKSAKNSSSGYFAQNSSSGFSAQNASSGKFAQNSSSGDFAQNSSSGYFAKNASSGHSAKNASSGDYAQNASSGDFAQNSSSGKSAKNSSSGDYASSIVTGKYSITADIGIDSKSKGIIGTWIVLAEYDKNTDGYYYPKNVKCGQIDGKILKENTWYTLKNGEFTKVI